MLEIFRNFNKYGKTAYSQKVNQHLTLKIVN